MSRPTISCSSSSRRSTTSRRRNRHADVAADAHRLRVRSRRHDRARSPDLRSRRERGRQRVHADDRRARAALVGQTTRPSCTYTDPRITGRCYLAIVQGGDGATCAVSRSVSYNPAHYESLRCRQSLRFGAHVIALRYRRTSATWRAPRCVRRRHRGRAGGAAGIDVGPIPRPAGSSTRMPTAP
jgi:hypothetical protein